MTRPSDAMKNRSIRWMTASKYAGFSLLELMIAITLGLLLAIGIVSLFSATSRTNKLQDALAHLQENGRFAVTRLESDMRMQSAQYCSTKSGTLQSSGIVDVWPGRAPMVFAANLAFADSGGKHSVDATGALSASNATGTYALSSRFFMQGYNCSTGTCSPVVPADIPAQGLAVGSRVPKSDVLTIRYQRGSGWPLAVPQPAPTCTSILLNSPAGVPGSGRDGNGNDVLNFDAAGAQLALISDCQNSSIVPVTAFAGTTLTLGGVLSGSTLNCTNPGDRDMRAFNFSKDFVTVTYFLQFVQDPNPDAQPNSGAPRRLIPSLMRKENGGTQQELVQGVDRLDFRYAVQDNNGATHYLTADVVNSNSAGITCAPKADTAVPPTGTTAPEPGCLWRAVTAVEAHMLLNSVDNLPALDPTSLSYRYVLDGSPGIRSDLPSGLQPGKMLRREFISLVSVRNYNP